MYFILNFSLLVTIFLQIFSITESKDKNLLARNLKMIDNILELLYKKIGRHRENRITEDLTKRKYSTNAQKIDFNFLEKKLNEIIKTRLAEVNNIKGTKEFKTKHTKGDKNIKYHDLEKLEDQMAIGYRNFKKQISKDINSKQYHDLKLAETDSLIKNVHDSDKQISHHSFHDLEGLRDQMKNDYKYHKTQISEDSNSKKDHDSKLAEIDLLVKKYQDSAKQTSHHQFHDLEELEDQMKNDYRNNKKQITEGSNSKKYHHLKLAQLDSLIKSYLDSEKQISDHEKNEEKKDTTFEELEKKLDRLIKIEAHKNLKNINDKTAYITFPPITSSPSPKNLHSKTKGFELLDKKLNELLDVLKKEL